MVVRSWYHVVVVVVEWHKFYLVEFDNLVQRWRDEILGSNIAAWRSYRYRSTGNFLLVKDWTS